jgi:hypothetical protein
MSIQNLNETTPQTASSPVDAAHALLGKVAALRQELPTFPFPVVPGTRQRMNTMKQIPPEFMEQSNVAIKTRPELKRGEVDPDELRNILQSALAYEPVADALEALAAELRTNTDTARHKAGTEALITYSVAQRLAKRPEYSDLVPIVQAMRRALRIPARLRKARKAKKDGTTSAAESHTATLIADIQPS